MKVILSVFGSLAVAALLIAVPAQAEMDTVSDSDMDAISGKGNASIVFGGYSWGDDHTADASDHKGALDNQGVITLSGINSANVWGAYAGAEVFADGNTGATEAEATANLAVGGF